MAFPSIEQIKVISSDADDIIVSASAGAGKTAVLTERLIQRILNGKTKDIKKVLVVTFTNASAADLRNNFRKNFNKKIGETWPPKNYIGDDIISKEDFIAQSKKLEEADISTIDSFCYSFVKDNAVSLGLSPSIRIIDPIESKQLKRLVAEMVLQLAYEGKVDGIDYSSINLATDCLRRKDGDNEADALIELYDSLTPFVDGVEEFEKTVDRYKDAFYHGFENTEWAKTILEDVASGLRLLKLQLDRVGIEDKTEVQIQYKNTIDNILIKAIKFADTEDYNNTCYELCRLNDLKSLTGKAAFPGATAIKGEAKKLINRDPEDPIFMPDARKENSNAETYYNAARAVKALLKEFEKKYADGKAKRGRVDFVDLERITLEALKKDDYKQKLREKYDEVYIDEYQDVNDVQATIFNSMKEAGIKRFAVGDIKQSIYGFRGSNPQNFEDSRTGGATVFYLSENFRCGKSIVDFANEVCGPLMENGCENFKYTSSDNLIYGGADGDDSVEVVFASEKNEPGVVARMIKEKAGKGVNPADICLLFNTTASVPSFISEIEKSGFGVANTKSENLFESPSVLIAISLLNVIDNPYREIHLTAVLMSPIYDFTLADLLSIRPTTSKGKEKGKFQKPLFDAVKEKSEEKDKLGEKCKKFIDDFDNIRKKISEPAHKLLWHAYCVTGMFSYALRGNEIGGKKAEKARLCSLYEYARTFEGGTYKGLYNFVAQINRMAEGNDKLEVTLPSDGQQVIVSTIHGSKGLQHDTVFLVKGKNPLINCNKKIVFSKKHGYLVAIEGEEYFVNEECGFANACILIEKERDEKEEKMRLLYVALTRAKRNLVVVSSLQYSKEGGTKATSSELLNTIRTNGEANRKLVDSLDDPKLKAKAVKKMDSFTEWISFATNGKYCDDNNIITLVDDSSGGGDLGKKKKNKYKAIITAKIKNTDYPFKAAESISSKYAVSKLKPDIFDESDFSDNIEHEEKEHRSKAKKPAFLEKSGKAKPLASDKGTATHQFMQFCDFNKLLSDGAKSELDRLLKDKFMSDESAKLIDLDEITGFIKSTTAREIAESQFVKRELVFNVFLKASLFTANEDFKKALEDEKVLVQGVIDCLYENQNGELVILDYKTDHMPDNVDDDGFVKLIKERHSNQLNYYKLAAEKITNRKICKMVVYSFAAGKEIEIEEKF